MCKQGREAASRAGVRPSAPILPSLSNLLIFILCPPTSWHLHLSSCPSALCRDARVLPALLLAPWLPNFWWQGCKLGCRQWGGRGMGVQGQVPP